VRTVKPFRDRNTLWYSEACSAEWVRAFFVREIATQALAAVGEPQTFAAVEALSSSIRRYARGVATLERPAAVRTRARSASAILPIVQQQLPAPSDPL
jgi:hypothetical protein